MWNDLGLIDKSRIMELAVKSGIKDLRTIEEVYNYASGGEVHKFDDGGYKRPKGSSLLKHLAYKIGADRSINQSGGAGIKDIIRAVTSKDVMLDDNKYAYIYGTGDRYPEVEEPIRGFDYSHYLEKNGYKGVKDVYGTINPNNEYHIDEQYKGLAEELAKHRYHFYDNADDMFIDADPDVLGYRDDVANFIHTFDLDKDGHVFVHDSDVYDFNPADYNYSRNRIKPIVSLEAKLMDKIGTPYTIRQEYQPLYFDGALRGSWGIQNHLEDLTDADIARITETGLLPEATIESEFSKGGKIHIKPSHRGRFTELLSRTGKSASWYKIHGTPAQKKMAVFALNARKWKHEDGGPLGTEDETLLEFLGPSRGEYLPQVYKEYFTNFKNYDDFNSRALIPDESKAVYDAMAQYYYNNDPNYASYFKLTQGPYKTYTDLRNKYEKDESQMVDLTSGNSYKLSSLGPNNRPTNKHGMRVSENLLNYIYDNAAKAGVDPKTAIALAVNESNLGNARAQKGKVGLFDLYSYWAGTGSVIYPNSKTTEPLSRIMNKVSSGEGLTSEDRETLNDLYLRYNKMAESIHPYKGNNVVADAVKYFNEDNYVGRTLPEETRRAYRDLVMSRFDELMNDQRFRAWWESKNQ